MTAATSARSSGADDFLLDHRGDDQDVVRRQVLRLRVPEVDLRPVAPEGIELTADQLPGGRRAARTRRSPGRGSPRAADASRRRRTCPGAASSPLPRDTADDESRGLILRFSLAISLTAPIRSAISVAREPLGKDDLQRRRGDRSRRRCLLLVVATPPTATSRARRRGRARRRAGRARSRASPPSGSARAAAAGRGGSEALTGTRCSTTSDSSTGDAQPHGHRLDGFLPRPAPRGRS